MTINSHPARLESGRHPRYWTFSATVLGNTAVAMIVALGITPPVLRALSIAAPGWSWAVFTAVAITTFAVASGATQLVRSRRFRSQPHPSAIS
jgi:hypothetical protein